MLFSEGSQMAAIKGLHPAEPSRRETVEAEAAVWVMIVVLLTLTLLATVNLLDKVGVN
jgi:hypothetical protein